MIDPRTASKYLGARMVTAVACDRASYALKFSDNNLDITNANLNDSGYLVEVHEGAENHPDYKGRIHWVEKKEFECCHTKLPELPVYNKLLHSLHIDQDHLLVRIKEAVDYTKSPAFLKLSSLGRELALEQVRVMTRYSSILDARIEQAEQEMPK
jgi:hypothetical protein